MASTQIATAQHRFEAKCIPEPNSGCVLWIGALAGNGYGNFHDGERVVGAHQYSWRLHNGPIPKGIYVCHDCDTPICVNPDHLFLDTPYGNQKDMAQKGRARSGMAEWKHSAELKARIQADSRSYRAIAEDYGLKFNTVKNIKAAKGRGIYTPRIAMLEQQNARLRAALSDAVALLEINPDASTPGTDVYTFLRADAPIALSRE